MQKPSPPERELVPILIAGHPYLHKGKAKHCKHSELNLFLYFMNSHILFILSESIALNKSSLYILPNMYCGKLIS